MQYYIKEHCYRVCFMQRLFICQGKKYSAGNPLFRKQKPLIIGQNHSATSRKTPDSQPADPSEG